MQPRPLQNLDILGVAFEVLGQHGGGFPQVATHQRAVHFDDTPELAHALGRAFLQQKVCVVLDAHGATDYWAPRRATVKDSTEFRPFDDISDGLTKPWQSGVHVPLPTTSTKGFKVHYSCWRTATKGRVGPSLARFTSTSDTGCPRGRSARRPIRERRVHLWQASTARDRSPRTFSTAAP